MSLSHLKLEELPYSTSDEKDTQSPATMVGEFLPTQSCPTLNASAAATEASELPGQTSLIPNEKSREFHVEQAQAVESGKSSKLKREAKKSAKVNTSDNPKREAGTSDMKKIVSTGSGGAAGHECRMCRTFVSGVDNWPEHLAGRRLKAAEAAAGEVGAGER
mmetsp:Transcript_19009/g.47756  ORF Transcript_19009/g.47756 Transcript_19009/m.47756 type:complete len:162 (-) Transcript_19009:3-488(-)